MKYRIEVSDETNKYAPKQVIVSQGTFEQMMADFYKAIGRMDTTSRHYHEQLMAWCKKLVGGNL